MYKYLLILLVVILNSCNVQTNFNGGFEKIDPKTNQPIDWTYGLNKNQALAYTVKLDSVNKKEGKYSLSIESTGKNNFDYGVIRYLIPEAFIGNKIQLSAYVKTEGVANGYAGLWLRLDGADKEMIRIDNMENRGITGTNEWKQYVVNLDYDENVKEIYFGGLLAGEGKTWFDNFEISIDGKKIENLKPRVFAKEEKDTKFDKGSSISALDPNTQQITNLAIIAQFWGFLKYHHPAVTKGNYNWDAELFKLLPSVIDAKNNTELSTALELYFDKLPKVNVCKSCNVKTIPTEIKPNYGELFTEKILSKNLTEKINFILKNANIKESYYVSMMPGVGNPKFQNENPYTAITSPDAGYRLLSLFRYWNMINYFFPYRDVIGQDWNLALKEMIPDFLAADNQRKYLISALKMFAKINDTHAYVMGLNNLVDDIRGKNTLPFRVKFVEEKLVVYDYFIDADSIKNAYRLGDEVVEINGEKVSSLIKKYDPLVAASNYDTKLRNLPLAFLARSNDKTMHLTISRAGKTSQQSINLIDYNSTYKIKTPAIKPYKIINEHIGYVYPGTYKNTDLPSIEKLFANTKGMVIDLRCYPSDFIPLTFGKYIKQNKTPFVRFTTGSISVPGTFQFKTELSNGGNKNYYKNKIIVIVDETTQSNAEYTTMAFQSSPNVMVIGSQTAGADGNVSTIVLPGGISSWISGIGVFYPDGKPTQRVGVSIDHLIKPTVKGIRNGKDELLEKAIQLLEKGG